MAVLSKGKISDRLKLEITDDRSLVVTPFDESMFDIDSLDLRLGSHFLFPPMPAVASMDIHDPKSFRGDVKIYAPKNGSLVLPAHQTVLGVTLEFIKLPYDVSGQILTKSSIARTFMIIETAPWIHPNYRGCLTLEIANVSNSALILHPGMPIGQLILLNVEDADKATRLTGAYVGPVQPESPHSQRRHSHSSGS